MGMCQGKFNFRVCIYINNNKNIKINIYYFRHKVDTKTPCNHYNKPTETQFHKNTYLYGFSTVKPIALRNPSCAI